MIFSLDVRRARKGDCLLLHYGTPADPGLAVIDGGPSGVYLPHLKPRLDEVRAARGLSAGDPLPVDLLMISHVDDDHVNGLLELTGELVEAADAGRRLPLRIRSVWHNTFDDVVGKSAEGARVRGRQPVRPRLARRRSRRGGPRPGRRESAGGHRPGHPLPRRYAQAEAPSQPRFDGRLVMAAKGAAALDMGKGLSFIVAGPMKPELVALQKKHDAFLTAKAKKKQEAALAAFTDSSVPNLSSLVVLARVGDRRILLTGDARGDKILEGLELAGALKPGKTLHVDVLKMPHHGSDRNMEQSFLERITADHYVMSGNGEHGNPERETLDMLRRARGNAAYTIHLTYPVKEIDAGRKKDWEKEQRKEKRRREKNAVAKVRANWSPAKNSLAALFDRHKAFAKKVVIVEEDAPHVIDLLDRTGF